MSVATLLILTVLCVLEADSACPCFSASDSDITKCVVATSSSSCGSWDGAYGRKECWLYEWPGTYGGDTTPTNPNFALHCSDRVSGTRCGVDQWLPGKRFLVQKGSSGSAFCKKHTYNCDGSISSTVHHTGLSDAEHQECAQILKDQAFNGNNDCWCGDISTNNGPFRKSNCGGQVGNTGFCYQSDCPSGSPALENDEDMDMNEYEIKVASAQESNTTISLSTGAFIGIILGVIILSIMFTAFVVWVYRKNKMNKYDLAAVKEEEDDEEEQDETTKITEN